MELLVVIAIIVILCALFMPVISRIRGDAQATTCLSNCRQIGSGLLEYAVDFEGRFPPNFGSGTLVPQSWYDSNKVGRYVPLSPYGALSGKSVFSCPCDDSASRSYEMNFWASSKVDAYMKSISPTPAIYAKEFWSSLTPSTSNLILLTEGWSELGSSTTGYYESATLGFAGATEGQRFGGNGGLTPWVCGRFGLVNCELNYTRHRTSLYNSAGNQPLGRINIVFADGHGGMFSNDDLVTASGQSSLIAKWNLVDAP